MVKIVRTLLLAIILLAIVIAPVSAQSIHIVNAATFNATDTVSPDTIVSVFGTNLTTTTASAVSGSPLQTTLGGVTLTINGVQALLLFVSPGQVNAVIAPATPTGMGTAVLTSSSGTFSTAINVLAKGTPGIFSLEGTGDHDGAVVNAFTGGLIAFSPTTGPAPTFLEIFVTGLDTTVAPVVTIGGVPVTVSFFGPAPGFSGLEQINVQLPASLAGAGRVELSIIQGTIMSNVVEVVLLPGANQKEFENDQDNQQRSRELSALASIPGTSLVLVADENDDVVRVVDVQAKKVTHVISLAGGAEPVSLAVTADGTLAVAAERSRGSIALIDLSTFMVKSEIATGSSPISVAISGTQAVVVNQNSDSVSFINLTTGQKANADVSVGGRAPRGVALNAAGTIAYVTVQGAGTVVPINLATFTAGTAISLGAMARPAAIQLIPSLGLLVVTEPGNSADGNVFIVNPATGTNATVSVNPAHSGGANDLVVAGTNVFFSDQTGGAVTMVPVTMLADGTITAPPTMISVGIGARALTIDVKDNLLVVSNEGSGELALVSLTSDTVVGQVDAVRTNQGCDDNGDDHSDGDCASNTPVISSLQPASGMAGTTLTLNIAGMNLNGAMTILFIDPKGGSDGGGGNGGGGNDGGGNGGHDSHGGHNPTGMTDPGITVTGITSTATSVTAQVQIAANHPASQRLVVVVTPNGMSSSQLTGADTFTTQ
jgi:uncharacterized protein (TIGR03437 family)